MTEREKFEMWFKDRYDPLVTTSVGSPMEEKWEAWQAALSSAPTPPEVEPALYVNSQALEREKYPSTKIERDEYYDTPLFTRPPAPNDEGFYGRACSRLVNENKELRAAAEEVLVAFDKSLSGCAVVERLRSALGKKEGE